MLFGLTPKFADQYPGPSPRRGLLIKTSVDSNILESLNEAERLEELNSNLSNIVPNISI